MISTFHGLEVAKRGMQVQQSALYTTGHNISNANTPGYTRQRVNMIQTSAFPSPSMNSPKIPGQLGTGVQVGEIQRVRDSFTDMQFRTESSKFGYWQSKADMLSQMEAVMNEPSDTGLSGVMDQFWSALQDLAVQPQNDGARRVVRERGIALANTFNYMSNSLQAIQSDYRNEIDVSQNKINSILRQINAVNKEIGSIEPHGYLPNDLYDQRDRLVDELSTMVNVKVVPKSSGGLASGAAEGMYDIYLANPQGGILKDANGREIKLIDASTGKATGIHIQYENRSEAGSPVKTIKFFELNENKEGFKNIANNTDADAATAKYTLNSFSAFNTNGALKGYIEGYGYMEGDKVKGLYNEMLADLDQMAFTFAQHFNRVHNSGWSLNDIRNGAKMDDNYFFAIGGSSKGAASSIKVSDHIIEDVQNIAAAAEGNVLAGMMKRELVKAGTVGNPAFTGIYNPSQKPADMTLPDGWPAAGGGNEISVQVSYLEKLDADTGENYDEWTFTFNTTDKDGNAIQAEYTSSDLNTAILGIDFDLANIADQSDGDTWAFTFKAEGMKSSDNAFIGNGSNALKLSEVKDAVISFGGNLTNVQSFYQGMIGKLGDNASEANRMQYTSATLKESVEQRRMSESSVSLDEEMMSMIKYQHAYNAAARNITLVDEMLDKIINGMGVGGR